MSMSSCGPSDGTTPISISRGILPISPVVSPMGIAGITGIAPPSHDNGLFVADHNVANWSSPP